MLLMLLLFFVVFFMMDRFFLFPSQSWQGPRKSLPQCHRQWGIPGHGLSQSIFPCAISRLHPPIHVRPLLSQLHSRSLIHSIYIPPLPSSVPPDPLMYSDSFAFHLPTSSLQLFVYNATRSRDDIRVQFQQQQQHTFRHRGHLQSHIIGTEAFAAFFVGRAAEVIFGSVRIRTRNKKQKNKKRHTNKTKWRQAKQIHKAQLPSQSHSSWSGAEREWPTEGHDSRPRELAEEEERRWYHRKINNSSVFLLLLGGFSCYLNLPTAGARFRYFFV